jgi:hypothetical protein
MRAWLAILTVAFVAIATTARAQTPASPAAGYDIHVTAPHVVDGEEHGPFHHYCKVISPEPIIQCLIFDSTEPNAPMTQVEYMVAKSITRSTISRDDWNDDWHDHAIEIASGRVKVLDVDDATAGQIASAASTTDGVIFHLWPIGSKIPTGDVSIAQAVGHEDMSEDEFKAPLAPAQE